MNPDFDGKGPARWNCKAAGVVDAPEDECGQRLGGTSPPRAMKHVLPVPRSVHPRQFDPFRPVLARRRSAFVNHCLGWRAVHPAVKDLGQTSQDGSMNERSSSKPSRLNTAVIGLALYGVTWTTHWFTIRSSLNRA